MKPSRSLLVLLLVFAVGGQSIQAQSTPSSRSCGTSSSEGAVPDTTVEYIKQFYMRGLAMYWAASLVYPPENNFTVGCMGSLVKSDVMITSAQCVQPTRPRQAMFLFCEADGGPGCQINVSRVVVHPNFTTSNLENDLALIKLNRNVYGIKPLCLPPTATSTVNTQFDILVVGTSLHQKGTPPPESNAFVHEMSFVDLVSKEDCGRSRDDINLGTSHLCARGQASNEPCSSDRGAPLMNIVNNDHYVLVGSVSKISANCGDSGKPTVYTNVASHLAWIKSTLETM